MIASLTGSNLTYRLLTLVVLAVAWEVFARMVGGLLIPTFLETAAGLGSLLTDPEFWTALVISNQALVVGFAVSVLLGVPIGLAMGRFRAMEQASDPYMNILLVTPMAAVIPLLVMSVGIGLASRVVLVVLFAIPMIVANARTGVRQVDPSLIEMARTFGASERSIWWRILIPGALPAVMTGLRIGLGRGITGMVVVELLMVSVGLGGLILEFRGFFRSELLYATVVLIVAEALLLISLAGWIERRVAPWASKGGLLEEAA